LILSDLEIMQRAKAGMIDPFEPMQVSDGVISYGLSSYGYDFRVAGEFKIFRPGWVTPKIIMEMTNDPDFATKTNSVVDPKAFDPECFRGVEIDTGSAVEIPGNSFVLGRTVERFVIPRDILTLCLGKSTYARCGIIVNVTPFEPGWEGYATIEISNTSPLPAKVYAGEGIGQVIFLRADQECQISYADRKGKYQNQPASVVTALLS
jgi:dCTP deaminase